MNIIHPKFAGIAFIVMGVSLGGCAGGANYHVQSTPNSPLPRHALADEIYLDGTGPSARRSMAVRDAEVETLHVAPPPAGSPSHAVARTRPTAIPRADNISASSAGTSGSRNSTPSDATKPFSRAWWEKEEQEDARLRDRMTICRGC